MGIFLIIFIILSVLLILKLNTNDFKGKSGEKLVAERLDIIDGYKYILNNIMFNDNGKSRQIDHIAITEYGIYIIETKNYAGDIYGRENSNEWQQYLNRKCFKFKNPIHQNYGHTEVVKKQLEGFIDTTVIYSIIVFIRRCKLHTDTKTPIIYEDQLASFIRNRAKILNKEQINQIYQILLDNSIKNKETIKNHKENVKNYIQYKEELIKEETCPSCYGKLIKRYGKKGYFYGCSNFPKCKYTKCIEEVERS